jgi:predicted transcriptional regulator
VKSAVIRLPPEVVERLDELTLKLRAARPGHAISRAAVVRVLVTSALAASRDGRDRRETGPPPDACDMHPSGPA